MTLPMPNLTPVDPEAVVAITRASTPTAIERQIGIIKAKFPGMPRANVEDLLGDHRTRVWDNVMAGCSAAAVDFQFSRFVLLCRATDWYRRDRRMKRDLERLSRLEGVGEEDSDVGLDA